MIDVIVPTFNRHKAIDRLIYDLQKQIDINFNLYIIDQSIKSYVHKINSIQGGSNMEEEFRSPILAKILEYKYLLQYNVISR